MIPIEKGIRKDLKRIIWVSILSVLILISVMVRSPLASQFYDDGLNRGSVSEWELDSLIEAKKYQSALVIVDSIIFMKENFTIFLDNTK